MLLDVGGGGRALIQNPVGRQSNVLRKIARHIGEKFAFGRFQSCFEGCILAQFCVRSCEENSASLVPGNCIYRIEA